MQALALARGRRRAGPGENGSMRVIGGRFRSRTLKAPSGERVRPTSDKLRETLFNILGPAVAGSQFIDAYAGSGAIGVEACSRGAEHVFWIESHRASLQILRDNLRALGLGPDAGTVVARPALAGLSELARRPEWVVRGGCDFVFLDPPYALEEEYEKVLQFLGRPSELVGPETLVIAEHARKSPPAEAYGELRRSRRLEQGDSGLSFYRLRRSADPAERQDKDVG